MSSSLLEPTDHTPEGFQPIQEDASERWLKRPLRQVAYPLWRFTSTQLLSRRYARRLPFKVDNWLWGQRGNDYYAHRKRVNRLSSVAGSRILVAGCGTGKDVASWLPYQPAEIVAVDYFNYERAWTQFRQLHAEELRHTRLEFRQADLLDLSELAESSFDVIASDALFEHVADLASVLRQFYRVLRPRGLLYATFGPLWYAWHGDHISGFDRIESGFNHLVLDQSEYARYIDTLGEFHHSEDDGRTWSKSGFFSYLQPHEYVQLLESAGFDREYLGVLIEPRAVQSLRRFPRLRASLLPKHEEMSLIVSGMTIIYRKPDGSGARRHVIPQSIRDI